MPEKEINEKLQKITQESQKLTDTMMLGESSDAIEKIAEFEKVLDEITK